MTSLITWIGIDSRAPASIYIASDSRISWGEKITWDFAQKVFAAKNHPDILGYFGDVLFPSQILSQITYLIDNNILFRDSASPETKWAKILSIIQNSFSTYPNEQSRFFTIVYVTRENSGMDSIFHMSSVEWKPKKGWSNNHWHDLPNESSLINAYGTGKRSVNKWYSYWNKTKHKRTSRSVFSAFCDALHSNEDPYSGGAPQLVGLYRIGPAKPFGIIYNNNKFLFGAHVGASEELSTIEWRNNLFERCDWKTMKPLQQAQLHGRPKGLGFG
jgi:hypothetical protein